MLEADALTVRAGSATLLDAVSAHFAKGRVTAVLGPNGAGKSTLLKCLCGLRSADGGAARLDGQPLAAMAAEARARRIGYLPQQAQLHWDVEVRALVALGRHPHRGGFGPAAARDEAAIDRALAETDAAAFAGRRAGTLSGGELARVMLARVLAGEPEWVLADEPFAALDIAHRLDLSDRLRAIAARGQGVIVVLHDLSLAARLADDVVLLDGGRLVAFGPADDVLGSPAVERVFGVAMERHVHADGTISLIPARRFS